VWHAGTPADAETVAALAARYAGLPPAYLQLLQAEDGSEGDLGVDPGWISLWPAAEVVALNIAYAIDTLLPGFVGFASNGGGELLAFDTRTTPWRVCMVPFTPMEETYSVQIAADFASLANQFRHFPPAG
jgi:hypothetical protein